MTLSRRHLLGIAAGAAAGAAMPAAVIAGAPATLGWSLTVRDFEPGASYRLLHWPRPPVFAADGTLAEPYGEKVPWIEVDGRMVEFDPVRHPEGRDDPTEWA